MALKFVSVVLFLLLFSAKTWAGVQFLSFVNGDPGLPGDGIFVGPSTIIPGTPGDLTLYELATPFQLDGISDGISFTVFPSTADLPVFQDVNFVIDIPIGFICSQGGTSIGLVGEPDSQIIFNGKSGFVYHYIQDTFEQVVQINNDNGCNITINDLYLDWFEFVSTVDFQHISPNIDAVAVGFGQNTNPAKDFIDSFNDLSLVFVPFNPSTQGISRNILDELIETAHKFSNIPTEKLIEIGQVLLFDLADLWACISVSSCVPSVFPKNNFFICDSQSCPVSVHIEQFEMASSPTAVFQFFNFNLLVQIEDPALFPIGTQFVTDIPFLGIGPSYSIVEYRNITKSSGTNLLELNVEGITLTNPAAPRIVSNIPALSVWGIIMLILALGILALIRLKKATYPNQRDPIKKR